MYITLPPLTPITITTTTNTTNHPLPNLHPLLLLLPPMPPLGASTLGAVWERFLAPKPLTNRSPSAPPKGEHLVSGW